MRGMGEEVVLYVLKAISEVCYRMAGNIGGEFNLVVWRMSGQSAKFKSIKYSANGDFAEHILYATAAVPSPAHAEIAVPRSARLKYANLKKSGK